MSLGEEMLLSLWAWLGLVGGGAVVCGGLWLLCRPARGDLLPTWPRRPAPWSGFVVAYAFLLYLLWPEALRPIINLLGEASEAGTEKLHPYLALACAFPFQLGSILLVVRRYSGARLDQLGLTTRRLPANVILGYLGWLVLCPVVYAVSYLTTWLYLEWTGLPPDEHTLTELIQDLHPVLEWLLLWFLAVVAAPVLEELLFRGLIQGWLLARPRGAPLAMALALALPMTILGTYKRARILFVLALVPGFLVLPGLLRWWRRRRSDKPPASNESLPLAAPGTPPEPAGEIRWTDRLGALLVALDRAGEDPRTRRAWAMYATATLFALIHPWPTPVPLFLLGLGLGWLAYRTQSLVGPMVLHALFNSVGCLIESLRH
jgi:membrane protease YdiL (CAAX protease family)